MEGRLGVVDFIAELPPAPLAAIPPAPPVGRCYQNIGTNRFAFEIDTNGDRPVLNPESGKIDVYDKDDPETVIYRFGNLYAYDSYTPPAQEAESTEPEESESTESMDSSQPNSNYYLADRLRFGNMNGANIMQYTYNGWNNQQFGFVKNANGSYRIVTRITGGAKCVAVQSASTSNGGNILQYAYGKQTNDNWFLETGRTLNTPLFGQEGEYWCWAACAQMVAYTNRPSTLSQSQIVTHIKKSAKDEGASIDELVNAVNFATGTTSYYATERALTQDELLAELKAGKPVIIWRDRYLSGERQGAHDIVVYGYELGTGTYQFKIHDPSPQNQGRSYTKTYAKLVEETGSDGFTRRWNKTVHR